MLPLFHSLSSLSPVSISFTIYLTIIIYYKSLTCVFVYFVKNVIAPKELRETLRSPSYNVKKLKLLMNHLCEIYEIAELVDALLWIFPLLETLFIEWWAEDEYEGSFNNISFKVLRIFYFFNMLVIAITCSYFFNYVSTTFYFLPKAD
jgi:hypothetical protein